jgi:hypothetical protein
MEMNRLMDQSSASGAVTSTTGSTTSDPAPPGYNPFDDSDPPLAVWEAVLDKFSVEQWDGGSKNWKRAEPVKFADVRQGWWRIAAVDGVKPSPAPILPEKCDHIFGEWDDGSMENYLVHLSYDVKDLGRDGTLFKFCPTCGIRISSIGQHVPVPKESDLCVCPQCRGVGWVNDGRVRVCPACRRSGYVSRANGMR